MPPAEVQQIYEDGVLEELARGFVRAASDATSRRCVKRARTSGSSSTQVDARRGGLEEVDDVDAEAGTKRRADLVKTLHARIMPPCQWRPGTAARKRETLAWMRRRSPMQQRSAMRRSLAAVPLLPWTLAAYALQASNTESGSSAVERTEERRPRRTKRAT